MYSVIKDIVVAVIFWVTVASTGKVSMDYVYNSIRKVTHQRVSTGLSSTTKFTEKLISNESETR